MLTDVRLVVLVLLNLLRRPVKVKRRDVVQFPGCDSYFNFMMEVVVVSVNDMVADNVSLRCLFPHAVGSIARAAQKGDVVPFFCFIRMNKAIVFFHKLSNLCDVLFNALKLDFASSKP